MWPGMRPVTVLSEGSQDFLGYRLRPEQPQVCYVDGRGAYGPNSTLSSRSNVKNIIRICTNRFVMDSNYQNQTLRFSYVAGFLFPLSLESGFRSLIVLYH